MLERGAHACAEERFVIGAICSTKEKQRLAVGLASDLKIVVSRNGEYLCERSKADGPTSVFDSADIPGRLREAIQLVQPWLEGEWWRLVSIATPLSLSMWSLVVPV